MRKISKRETTTASLSGPIEMRTVPGCPEVDRRLAGASVQRPHSTRPLLSRQTESPVAPVGSRDRRLHADDIVRSPPLNSDSSGVSNTDHARLHTRSPLHSVMLWTRVITLWSICCQKKNRIRKRRGRLLFRKRFPVAARPFRFRFPIGQARRFADDQAFDQHRDGGD